MTSKREREREKERKPWFYTVCRVSVSTSVVQYMSAVIPNDVSRDVGTHHLSMPTIYMIFFYYNWKNRFILTGKELKKVLSSFRLISNSKFDSRWLNSFWDKYIYIYSFLLFNNDDNRSIVRKIIDDRLLLYKGNYTRLIESHIYTWTLFDIVCSFVCNNLRIKFCFFFFSSLFD